MENSIIKIEVQNNMACVSSLQIAEAFGKNHKDVLRDIRVTIEKCSSKFTERRFALSEYEDSTGRKLPLYLLSRDGFMMVTMGYTTIEAMSIKEAYIEEFNRMEDTLRNKTPALPDFTNPVDSARAWAEMAIKFADAEEGRLLAIEEASKNKRAAISAGLRATVMQERAREANATVAILTHVTKTYTATEIAKELGFSSAQKLNKELCARHIQFKQNGTYVLYAKYADLGYDQIKQEVLDNGKIVYHRRFTQRGREWLVKLFEGFTPVDDDEE